MIDFKKPITEWETTDLKERLHYLRNEIPFMFMPPDISIEKVKEYDDIINDAVKIENELKKRGQI